MQAPVGTALVIHHLCARGFGNLLGGWQVGQQAGHIQHLLLAEARIHTRDQLGQRQVAGGSCDPQRLVAGRLAHADELQADRHMGNRRRGNFAHARQLHAVTMQRGPMLRDNGHHYPAATALQFVKEGAKLAKQAIGAGGIVGHAGTAVGSDDTVAVMQADAVVEQ